MSTTVPVFDWILADGTSIGLGTRREFDHWMAEGIIPADATCGEILCHEPASEDARREKAWAA